MQLEQYIRTRLETKPICLMTHVIAVSSYSDNLRELEIMAHHNVDLVEFKCPFPNRLPMARCLPSQSRS